MNKIISILAVCAAAVSVNAADDFWAGLTPGTATRVPLPSFSAPSQVFTMPRAHVYTAPATPIHVSSYTTTAGTYVAPYIRSAPNGTQADNYSAKGIVNPWTGVAGTVRPTK